MNADKIAQELADYDADTLESLIGQANQEYWDNHAATLPDELYDQLVEALKCLNPKADVLLKMGPSVSSTVTGVEPLDLETAEEILPQRRLGYPVAHKRPMLSLDKCYDGPSLRDWAEKIEGEIFMMPKMDGIACSLRYSAEGVLILAATRGSGSQGEDITVNARVIDSIPNEIDAELLDGLDELEIRGEIYMKLSVFERFAEEYSNPRNLTAGAIKNKDTQKSKSYGLSFYAYDILDPRQKNERDKQDLLTKIGFEVEESEFIERDDLEASFMRFTEKRPNLNYEIDGVVYRASLVSEHIRLGETGHHPRWAVAYKFQGDSGETKLRDVAWSVSRTGTITPVAMLEPVELSGAMIGRASLHNVNRFEGLGLSVGCTVEVTRRGGVIPMVERVLKSEVDAQTYKLPTSCPGCGGPVERRKKREGEFLYCVTPDNCLTARLGELKHYATVTDIEGFGPKILSKAFEAGMLSSPEDFYRLQVEDLEKLERLGRKSAQNLVDEIEARRQLKLPVFLQALGVDHLGKQNSVMLSREFKTLERVRGLGREELMGVHGIKDAIADALVDGLARRDNFIERLLNFVSVTDFEDDAAPQLAPDEGLDSKSFLFTGALERFTRTEAQKRVKALGGVAASGVNKKLDYLVVGTGKGNKSSKQTKAEALIEAGGIPLQVIDEVVFLEMIESIEMAN